MVELYYYQLDAINRLRNGSILAGGVGSGKSITALAYYLLKVTEGKIKTGRINENDSKDLLIPAYEPMKKPRDLYIITTAKKRDNKEWEEECTRFCLIKDGIYGVNITIDSWNNIKKYKDVVSSFFIFDEQRVVGSGSWVKSFLTITKKNQWILASATPGDVWSDYIPVFVANGFYKNKTDFCTRHCVYAQFSKYPKIERYIGVKLLEKYRDSILVTMEDNRCTRRHNLDVITDFNDVAYRMVFKDRWNPYDNEPIEETGKWMYLLRRVVNDDPSRIQKVKEIVQSKKKCIIFYNFNYELDSLRTFCKLERIPFAEWNGQKHEPLPVGKQWCYLVQFTAGSEGWNCITTDTVIFYSQPYSYRALEQASGRIDRINTPYTDLYYYHLHSQAVIDRAIHRKLKEKKNFNESSFLKRQTQKERKKEI